MPTKLNLTAMAPSKLTALLLIFFAFAQTYAQSGCTDVTACNFDPIAITDDGSCAFDIDCDGTCGGIFIEDECGNCFDPNSLDLTETFSFTGAIETWTVPEGASYISIEAFGAEGGGNGNPGHGSRVKGEFEVTEGQTLRILVGEQGGTWDSGSGAGGGGSFVVLEDNAGAYTMFDGQNVTPLLVAGGGAGVCSNGSGQAGRIDLDGGGLVPGTDCNGGGTGSPGSGGGGGFCGPGTTGVYGTGGSSFLSGGAGGANGGFGCGGGATSGGNWAAGGGGGWSGGSGNQKLQNNAGGGGSYNVGLNQETEEGIRTGNGQVIISYAIPPECIPGCTDPVACNFNPEATDDDGSCGYEIDCAGVCGGTSVIDECDVCYDPEFDGITVQQFDFTGGSQSFTVPAGVDSLFVEVYGAQGGASGGCNANDTQDDGGLGGFASGNILVAEGDVLYIYVGGQGGLNGGAGWNGGGVGGQFAGGGGGASDIRTQLGFNSSRIIVAGGGGGGSYGCGADYGSGGNGGGLNGDAGVALLGGNAGGGGGPVSGGAAGSAPSGSGGFGNGGGSPQTHVAGGGGGWYGGGAAYQAGGGGGASYINGVLDGSTESGVHTGNGIVRITYRLEYDPCITDCNGVFNGDAFIDECGTCVGGDTGLDACIPGCTDPAACNYDLTATEDDSSCILEVDCNGVCGGNAISDACGNCYELSDFPEEFTAFGFTGSVQSFVIPEGVTSIRANVWGAQGGNSNSCVDGETVQTDGGLGGYAEGDLNVAPGQTLYIYVGGQGSATGTGGWNGGGAGGNFGGGGGGASDVRTTLGNLSSRVIVAGGGGAGSTGCPDFGSGGDGGGLSGEPGISLNGNTPGGGGSQGAGGSIGTTPAQPGGFGVGGGVFSSGVSGGGGGWYGGGAAFQSGGGGGSSYIDGVNNAATEPGIRQGNGQVIIYYTALPECTLGCTDPEATNYDPSASDDDGSCEYEGCTDIAAANFDPAATVDDGSCLYEGCTDPLATNYDPNADIDDGSCIVEGCTDPAATNYDPLANTDDGSCILEGCTNPEADNFDPNADVDDGSCIIEGCTAYFANNYNPEATVDDGSCACGDILGCTDPAAFNYDDQATADDGSCIPVIEGCTDWNANNYNPEANAEDNSCTYDVMGCTDVTAVNYDPAATLDNGGCIASRPGCLDPAAVNYQDYANVEDNSTCQYPESGEIYCGPDTFWDPEIEQCVPFNECPADLNGDLIVNSADLLIFLSFYSLTCTDIGE